VIKGFTRPEKPPKDEKKPEPRKSALLEIINLSRLTSKKSIKFKLGEDKLEGAAVIRKCGEHLDGGDYVLPKCLRVDLQRKLTSMLT